MATFTAESLSSHNGVIESTIYISVKGVVYDCTSGADFYGEGQSYHVFAGKEVSRCLAKMIIGDDEANAGWNHLTEEHLESLASWEAHYKSKYPRIGIFTPDPGFLERAMRFEE